MRSSAWIWLFSSMQSTIACSGGFRYRPTTSTSFSSNRLSLESLNVLTWWGLRPRAAQIRCTVAALTPWALAIERQLQCVSPAGFSCSVACTIAATFSGGIEGFRPLPGRTPENAFNPSCSNRSRHAATVVADRPATAAIRVLAIPRPAISNTLARCTSR